MDFLSDAACLFSANAPALAAGLVAAYGWVHYLTIFAVSFSSSHFIPQEEEEKVSHVMFLQDSGDCWNHARL